MQDTDRLAAVTAAERALAAYDATKQGEIPQSVAMQLAAALKRLLAIS